MEREQVLKGLEQITNDPFMNARADYWVLVCKSALAMLKKQQEQIDKLIEESASNAEMAEGLKELLKEQEEQIRQLTEELEELRKKRNEVYYSGYDGSFIL